MLSTSDKVTLLGYKLRRNVTDWCGIKHNYGTSPDLITSGGRNYFQNIEQVEKWVRDVNEIRSFQGEGGSLIDYLAPNTAYTRLASSRSKSDDNSTAANR
jgi:hypothetical protein